MMGTIIDTTGSKAVIFSVVSLIAFFSAFTIIWASPGKRLTANAIPAEVS